ncbi:MAG: copper resistance protein CopC [Pseudolabrys sp.]|nr:copper resistance protein CopC [Pseudolabrys sp.]
MTGAAARIVWLAILLTAALCSAAGPAFAHATLVRAEPRDGAMLSAAPAELSLTFNEPVAGLVFKLVSPDGGTSNPAFVVEDRTVTLRAPSLLGQGSYILSWRVASADGHPVGGALQFSIGVRSSAPANINSTDRGLAVAIWLARLAIYAGLFIGIGGLAFPVWTGTKLPPKAAAVVASVSAVAFAAIPLSIGFQGVDALALPLESFWRPEAYIAGLKTVYATSALIAGCGLAISFAVAGARNRNLTRLLSLSSIVLAAAALAASGHASNAMPQWLTRPSVFIHGIAVALWAGSLIPLWFLFRATARHSVVLLRFSRAIMFVLAGLLISGTILAVIQIEHAAAIWTTDYGRIFAAKLVLVATLLCIAAYNRYVLTPGVLRARAKARRLFVRSVGAELGCIIAILGLVALWRFTPPPRSIASGEPAFVHLHGEKVMADVTMSPGRAGPIELRIHLMQEDFTSLRAKEVTVALSAPGLEGLQRAARQGNDGDWRVTNVSLPMGGVWTVRVETLVDDFRREILDGPLVVGR